MFSIARKVTLTKDSALESQDRGEERVTSKQSKKDYSPSSHGGKKNKKGPEEKFTHLNVTKESLISVIKGKTWSKRSYTLEPTHITHPR